MNWDDLKIFAAVARRSKLSIAAKALRMNETTVSRRIKRLENDLGQTLFERLRRGHHLTPHGDTLLQKVEQIEDISASIAGPNTARGMHISGSLRISAAEGFGAQIMAPAMAQFSILYPNIEIDLVSGSGFLSLSRREADIAIGLSRSKSNKILSTPLVEYGLGLYASADWFIHNTTPTTLADLKNHTMIGYVDDLIYSPQLRYLEESLPDITPSLRASSIIAQAEMIRHGAGIGILPIFLASPTLVRLLPGAYNIKRKFWLSVHREIAESARTKAFTQFMHQYLQNNPSLSQPRG